MNYMRVALDQQGAGALSREAGAFRFRIKNLKHTRLGSIPQVWNAEAAALLCLGTGDLVRHVGADRVAGCALRRLCKMLALHSTVGEHDRSSSGMCA